MKERRWLYLLVVAVSVLLIAMAFVIVEYLVSYSYKDCITQIVHSRPDDESKNQSSLVIHSLWVYGACAFHILDIHSGAFTFLASIAIAAFTFTLWVSTDKLFMIGREQSDIARRALFDLERPYLFVEVSEGINVRETNGGHEVAIVTVKVINHGRFPADVIQAKAGVYRSAPQAIARIFDRPELIQVVGVERPLDGIEIQVPDEIDLFWGPVNDIGQTTQAYPKQILGRHTFLRVDLRYEGLKETLYITDFIWRWDHGPNCWVLYTKHRT